MELSEIQTFIETNKEKPEVQKYVNSFITTDRVNSFLQNEEGAKIIQPIKDSHFTKSLETWKQKNLQSIIDEAISKAHPKETEEQKRIRKLEEENLKMQKQSKLSEMKSKAIKFASEKNIPASLFDYLNYPETEEELNTALGSVAQIFNEHILKQNGRTRPGSKGNDNPKVNMNNFIRTAAGRQ